MARTRKDIEDDLTNLRRILSSGVLTDTQDGKTTTFRSRAELSATIRDLEDELNKADGVEPENRLYRNVSLDNGAAL